MITLITSELYLETKAIKKWMPIGDLIPFPMANGETFSAFSLSCGYCMSKVSYKSMHGIITESIPSLLVMSGGFKCNQCGQSHLFDFRVRVIAGNQVAIEFINNAGGLGSLLPAKSGSAIHKLAANTKRLLTRIMGGA